MGCTYWSVPMMSSRYSSRPVSFLSSPLGRIMLICSTSPCTQAAQLAGIQAAQWSMGGCVHACVFVREVEVSTRAADTAHV